MLFERIINLIFGKVADQGPHNVAHAIVWSAQIMRKAQHQEISISFHGGRRTGDDISEKLKKLPFW